jgi:DNA excision repair protein ERCC-2
MKKFSIGVSDFALPSPRRGSIELHSGFGQGKNMGIEIHQEVQELRRKTHVNYKAEVHLTHEFESSDYIFEVSGRMDGLIDDTPPTIEEIKTGFNVFELFEKLRKNPDHPYCLQLKTYGYIYWLLHKKIPVLTFHLVSTRHEKSIDLEIKLDLDDYEQWLTRRLAELNSEAYEFEKRIERRKRVAKNLAFPFESPREGQIDLIRTIEDGIEAKRPMLIQAPTGLGKTVGVLFPTLKDSLSNGQKVIYVTPKNSQHAVAEDAIDRLQEAGANIKSMTLTAKSKMCFKNEPVCNPEFCEFAKNHYSKVADNNLPEKLSKKRILSTKTFQKMAAEYEVCPFELQYEAAKLVDTVICDYNYVFSSFASPQRLSGEVFTAKGKPNLVIDEAHNLPARAMDYYSPTLSVHVLEKMRESIKHIRLEFQREAEKHLDTCIAIIRKCRPENTPIPCKIQPPTNEFIKQDKKLKDFLASYLKSDADIQAGDFVIKLCFYWYEFTEALEFIDGGRSEFFTTYNNNPDMVRIVCCDASEMLQDTFDNYSHVVGFSATLKPFDYYSKLSGLSKKNLKTAEFTSPFPKQNRKILLIPQISSKYSDRERNYPKIAETIKRISEIKKGNYFAFFPSFDFMDRVHRIFNPAEGFTTIKQERFMRRDSIQDVLHKLGEPNSANIFFAVQGGVFSEGVDYPGKMAIGAFVVGPPLPTFDLEREKMREYYEENYLAGFDYAYTYPAMAKAVQAAGRVIRSETDQGIIVLMDNRFGHENYAKSMPQDWFGENPHELVSTSILNDVKNFWDSVL